MGQGDLLCRLEQRLQCGGARALEAAASRVLSLRVERGLRIREARGRVMSGGGLQCRGWEPGGVGAVAAAVAAEA